MSQTYTMWEEAVAEQVAQLLEVSYSEAQAIMDSQVFTVQQAWGKGFNAEQTAAKVVADSAPAI